MKNITFFGVLSIFLALSAGCLPVTEEEVLTEVRMDSEDKIFQKIYAFQDEQITDSLIPFFNHKDPTYRNAAALAFASTKDEKAIDSLVALLGDDIEKVRETAAYALGQIGSEKAVLSLIQAFEQEDSLRLHRQLNAAILEATGKCGGEQYLKFLAAVESYKETDTILLEGLAKGIYRFATRGLTLPEGSQKMVDFATSKSIPARARFWAAHYLNRAPDINLKSYAHELALAVMEEEDAYIRMAMAIGLGKSKEQEALDTLNQLFDKEQDYRVRCNIIRACRNFEYAGARNIVLKGLRDENIHVANTAADFFVENGTGYDGNFYLRLAREKHPWQVELKLFQAANRHLSLVFSTTKTIINQELENRFSLVENPYEKAAVLTALGEFPWNYRNIKTFGFPFGHPAVRTAAMNALANIAKYPDFDRFFGQSAHRVKQELANYIVEGIGTGDVAIIATAADMITESPIDFKDFIQDVSFLEDAKKKLPLPEAIETLYALEKAISKLEGREEPVLPKPVFNNPVDWNRVLEIKEKTKALIQTTKGNIKLSFFSWEAPATVANFVKLARDGFYDGKNFHRVVPNFVIQGGCPRGDGFGSLDYTIRSELPPLSYNREGLVGMASAGNHTECTQFFITHSPTPHLDGNYTIFAEVVEGMEVVHQIEIGDKIDKISIIE